jgi:uncharacterized metal-binding protein
MKASDALMLTGTILQLIFLGSVLFMTMPLIPTAILVVLGIAYQVYGVVLSYEGS